MDFNLRPYTFHLSPLTLQLLGAQNEKVLDIVVDKRNYSFVLFNITGRSNNTAYD